MIERLEYASPIDVNNAEDCFFYHSMDIPGHGEVEGQWDLRLSIRQYLGNFKFSNKRVLDVGTASGFLTFEMEKLGAKVVSFDMQDGTQWDIVPHFKIQPRMGEILNKNQRLHERLKNSYWFTHKRINSAARAYYGDIYNLPNGLGKFDVVVFGMILSHLRDPFKALYSASLLAKDTIIVTNQTIRPINDNVSLAYFAPNPNDESILQTWWSFSPKCIETMLGVLGFKVTYTVDSLAKCLVEGRSGYEKCTAFVAKRSDDPVIHPTEKGLLKRLIVRGFIKTLKLYQRLRYK
ncbi:MAG: methyltransferase domain-containing protein [Desulfobacterales bacterium]|nr:methyltransferase domain-containing protein [Desulfobacterales bacterium]